MSSGDLCVDDILGLVPCDNITITAPAPGPPSAPGDFPGGLPREAGKPGDPLYGFPSPCGPKDSECQYRFWLKAGGWNNCVNQGGKGGRCNDRDYQAAICALEKGTNICSDYCGTCRPGDTPWYPGKPPYPASATVVPGGGPKLAPANSPGRQPFGSATDAFVGAPGGALPFTLTSDVGGAVGSSGGIPTLLDLAAVAGGAVLRGLGWLGAFLTPGVTEDPNNVFFDPLSPEFRPLNSPRGDRPDTILPDVIGVPIPDPGVEEFTITAPRLRPIGNPGIFDPLAPVVGLPTTISLPFGAPGIGVPSPSSRPGPSSKPFGEPSVPDYSPYGPPSLDPVSIPTPSPPRASPGSPPPVPLVTLPPYMPWVGDPLISAPQRFATPTQQPKPPPISDPLTDPNPLELPSSAPPRVGAPTSTGRCPPCKEKKKERKKREPRQVCYRGTYVETALGLRKSRGVQVPCQ